MTLCFLRRLMCRQFRTYFLLLLFAIVICQSLFVLFLLAKVKDSETPTELASLYSQRNRENHKNESTSTTVHGFCGTLGKTALSAIKRATTSKCKEELTEIACKLKMNQLVPERLPNYCLRKDSVPGSLLGCFHDSKESRILSSFGVKISGLNVQKCIDICGQSAYGYAGVHNGKECYCGAKKPSLEHLLTRAYCNVPCDGKTSQTCGGIDATEIFDTGVPPKVSRSLGSPTLNGTTKIAFILTLNGRSLRQVTRLLRVIYRPQHAYLIHVDARHDYMYRNLLKLELLYPNIHLARKRHSSIWGGASLLDVILEGIELLLNTNKDWQFVFNLSESDFPLKSIESLEAFLAANPNRNFLKSHGRQTRQFIHKQGLDRVFHQCESRMWRLGDRVLPAGIRIDGGSDWIGLTRDFATYATSAEPDALLSGLKELYRHTLLPAESFFHVLVLNSKYCETYADNNLRMTLWRRSQGCLCQHRNVVDWCGCSPMVFRTGDWDHLTNVMSKTNVFFARKFEAAIDQSIINRLEEQIGISNQELRGWDRYWESVFHITDATPPPDEALLAVATSLARHALSLLLQNKPENCPVFKPVSIISVTSYFRLDRYQGALIYFESDVNSSKFEFLAKPLSKISYMEGASEVLNSVEVGSDYDPKEQILRNRAGILSPKSKPTVVYRWNLRANLTSEIIHFVWFDPDRGLRGVQQGNVSENIKVGFHILELDFLTPGIWTLMVVRNRKSIAQVDFLVVPVGNTSNTQDSTKTVLASHKAWEKHLPNDSFAGVNRRRYLTETDASSYIDGVTAEFYAIQDICFDGSFPCELASSSGWQTCGSSDWSSLSPDPKSLFPKSSINS